MQRSIMKTTRSMTDRLGRAQTAILNARGNAVIAALLEPRGYDRAELDHGQALHDAAEAAVAQRKSAASAQWEAGEDFRKARRAARAAFQASAA